MFKDLKEGTNKPIKIANENKNKQGNDITKIVQDRKVEIE